MKIKKICYNLRITPTPKKEKKGIVINFLKNEDFYKKKERES
jgi:hypothetical protein